jgi:type VI secretion system secreted protein Hcp
MKGVTLKRSRVIQLGLLVLVAIVASGVIAALAFGHSAAVPATAGAPVTVTGQLAINGTTLNVTSFSVGESNPVTIGPTGTGAGAGKASFSDLNVTASVDASTPVLNAAVASGHHFPTAVLTFTWGATGSTPATLTYELDDVAIESIQQSGGTSAPVESLSLAFAKVHWTYTDANGTTTSGWDVAANTSLP